MSIHEKYSQKHWINLWKLAIHLNFPQSLNCIQFFKISFQDDTVCLIDIEFDKSQR